MMPVMPADTPPQRPDQMPASAWDIQAPYAPGSPDPVRAHGDADAGGRDDVAGTVAGAVSSAEARYAEHEADTFTQGSRIGDPVTLPKGTLDPGVGTLGEAEPAGSYYDPPRDYGGDR